MSDLNEQFKRNRGLTDTGKDRIDRANKTFDKARQESINRGNKHVDGSKNGWGSGS